jgi:uncharacterized protein (DUF2384 family)
MHAAVAIHPPALVAEDGRILSAAIARVAELWGITNEQLGRVLGLSASTASRLRSGAFQLAPGGKPFEMGQLLARLFRSLDALLGSDDAASRAWLATPSLDLDARPIDRILSARGLVEVCDLVDGYRGRV